MARKRTGKRYSEKAKARLLKLAAETSASHVQRTHGVTHESLARWKKEAEARKPLRGQQVPAVLPGPEPDMPDDFIVGGARATAAGSNGHAPPAPPLPRITIHVPLDAIPALRDIVRDELPAIVRAEMERRFGGGS